MLYTLIMNNDTSKLIVRLDKAVHQRLKVAVANGKADSMQAIVAKMIQTWLDENHAWHFFTYHAIMLSVQSDTTGY